MKAIFTVKVKKPFKTRYENILGYYTKTEVLGIAKDFLKDNYSVIIQLVQPGRKYD